MAEYEKIVEDGKAKYVETKTIEVQYDLDVLKRERDFRKEKYEELKALVEQLESL